MGYYTTYTLTIKEGFTPQVGKDLDELLERYDASYPFCKRCYNTYDTRNEYKWYEHEDDMKKISKELGEDVLLLLEGEGEEGMDVWRKYFRNGKIATYYPEIIWKEFSEEDLR